MTDEHGTQELERPVARVTVTTDPELLPAVVDFVGQVAHGLGLKDRAAEHLDSFAEQCCRAVRWVFRAAHGPASILEATGARTL